LLVGFPLLRRHHLVASAPRLETRKLHIAYAKSEGSLGIVP
jgi:hypothetical protein